MCEQESYENQVFMSSQNEKTACVVVTLSAATKSKPTLEEPSSITSASFSGNNAISGYLLYIEAYRANS